MKAHRPTAVSILREANALGQPVRIVYTHAGDMIIELCALTDADLASHVPDHDTLIAPTYIAEAFTRRIHNAQKRAS